MLFKDCFVAGATQSRGAKDQCEEPSLEAGHNAADETGGEWSERRLRGRLN